MPFAHNQGVKLFWREGGIASAPPVLLLHPIGCDHAVFDLVSVHLAEYARVLRMDVRGHGASDAPQGPYTLSKLAEDAGVVLDAAKADTALICGVSLGGMIAMELALAAPSRVRGLVLACTSASVDPLLWRTRIDAVENHGIAAIADTLMKRYLREGFEHLRPERAHGVRATLMSTPASGYGGAAAAIASMTLKERLAAIATPTTIVTGRYDIAAPLTPDGEILLGAIAGSVHAELHTGHLPPIEAPRAFAALIVERLRATTEAREVTQRTAGEVRRRAMLGDAWVDTAKARTNTFDAPFQDYIERTVWGDIWLRPGLSSETRRLLAIAVTAALGRYEEMGLHVGAALAQQALTREEIQEALLQIAAYAGVPAANSAFAEAAARLAEQDSTGHL